jgi:hypothetical protein
LPAIGFHTAKRDIMVASRKVVPIVTGGILTVSIITVKTSITDTMAENLPIGDTIIEDTMTEGALMGGALLEDLPVGYLDSLSVAYSNQWGQVPE